MQETSLQKCALGFCQVSSLLHQACLDKVSLWYLMLDRWNLHPCFSPGMCQTDRQTDIFAILISPVHGTINNLYTVFMCRGSFILAVFYYVLYNMSTGIKVYYFSLSVLSLLIRSSLALCPSANNTNTQIQRSQRFSQISKKKNPQ